MFVNDFKIDFNNINPNQESTSQENQQITLLNQFTISGKQVEQYKQNLNL